MSYCRITELAKVGRHFCRSRAGYSGTHPVRSSPSWTTPQSLL